MKNIVISFSNSYNYSKYVIDKYKSIYNYMCKNEILV